MALPLVRARTPHHASIEFENKLGGPSLVEDHRTEERGRSINQLSEKNTTFRTESEKGIDTLVYNRMESTSPEPLDWSSEPIEEENQPNSGQDGDGLDGDGLDGDGQDGDGQDGDGQDGDGLDGD